VGHNRGQQGFRVHAVVACRSCHHRKWGRLRFVEELCERELSISTVRTDNLHALIYAVEHGLGHERLAHRANHLTMIVMAI
jgi:hypothetical protein